MARVNVILPKMGEGVIEATILKWVKQIGDQVAYDETIVEIATDKVDSEVPSPQEGKLIAIHFQENDVVPVGEVIAVLETDGPDNEVTESKPDKKSSEKIETEENKTSNKEDKISEKSFTETTKVEIASSDQTEIQSQKKSFKFFSPLVKSMAKKENISETELDNIKGSGENGRIIKRDIENYLSKKRSGQVESGQEFQASMAVPTYQVTGGEVEIIEMDRMRKLIADYMVESKKTSPHVTSMVEADVTNVYKWRAKNKNAFQAKYNQKLTFTPIFIQAIVKAIKDFPMINVSVDGSKIIVKKSINIGMAAALPSGNLIVPVIKNADMLSLAGLAAAVNDLAERARTNSLKPDEIQGGTYTLTNLGSFGNVIGTPIINQPEVAILATGAIKKKPAVLELPEGDVIAIRHMMYLSHAYDHRVVDGFLGGSFVRRVADYLENFDPDQAI